jgi:hypothetical protein
LPFTFLLLTLERGDLYALAEKATQAQDEQAQAEEETPQAPAQEEALELNER